MSKYFWLAAVAAFSLVVVGCGSDESDGPDTSDTGFPACEVEDETWIGEECLSNNDCFRLSCDGAAYCLFDPIVPKGWCTRNCIEEDGTGIPGAGCGQFGTSCVNMIGLSSPICAETCVPDDKVNVCDLDINTCSATRGWSEEAKSATCGMPACFRDEDCASVIYDWPVTDGGVCKFSEDCDRFSGGTCESGKCFYGKTCDTDTGRCVFKNPDPVEAKIGDPCKHDYDCASGMECLTSVNFPDGKVVEFPNGYCSKTGCSVTKPGHYAATSDFKGKDEYDCGPQGVCYGSFYTGGFCMRACQRSALTGHLHCRNDAWDTTQGPNLDNPGDYECYEYPSQFQLDYVKNAGSSNPDEGSMTIAEKPFCVPAGLLFDGDCSQISEYAIDCLYIVGGNGINDEEMLCRDQSDPETIYEDGAQGVCLDITTSSPFPGEPFRYSYPLVAKIQFAEGVTTPDVERVIVRFDTVDPAGAPIPDAASDIEGYFILASENAYEYAAAPVRTADLGGIPIEARPISRAPVDHTLAPGTYFISIILFVDDDGATSGVDPVAGDYVWVSTQAYDFEAGEVDLGTLTFSELP